MKLELECYFKDTRTLMSKVWQMVKMIESGKTTNNDGTAKFHVLLTDEPKWRFETHDGVEYVVFQSKMNNEV